MQGKRNKRSWGKGGGGKRNPQTLTEALNLRAEALTGGIGVGTPRKHLGRKSWHALYRKHLTESMFCLTGKCAEYGVKPIKRRPRRVEKKGRGGGHRKQGADYRLAPEALLKGNEGGDDYSKIARRRGKYAGKKRMGREEGELPLRRYARRSNPSFSKKKKTGC